MNENDYHIVLELPQHGFDRPRMYMATLEELRAKEWKPNGDYRNISDDTVIDEHGKRLSEAFDGWDAKGNDAWVSTAGHSKTHLERKKK